MEDFNKLYAMFSKQLFKYLFFLSGDRALAEELLQETFYQAIKSIHRFKGNSKVSTWLFQIAKHVHYKHLEKRHKEKSALTEEDREIPDFCTPESSSIEKERSIQLMTAIHKLKEPYREVITLRTYSELSFREIGELFEQSEGWSRTIFYRGKLQLKDILVKDRWEE